MRFKVLGGIMVGVLAVAIALGIYRAGTSRPAIAAAPIQVGGISVSGEGSVEGRPNIAYINLGFTAENASLAVAQREAASKMNAILAKIKALGVAAKDIQTANLNIWRDQERKVFVVSNDVRVTVRQIDSSSELLDAAIAAGANSVQGISFDIEDRTTLEKQAREKAMQAAAVLAAELARLGGVNLGPPTSISYGAATPPVVYAEARQLAAADMASTPIEPGQLTVAVSVQVTYAMR